jgi:hypothetical protein
VLNWVWVIQRALTPTNATASTLVATMMSVSLVRIDRTL